MTFLKERPLTKPEESILALGLNFVPVPTSIPEKTIIAETEAVARSLEEEDAAKLRSAVQNCLNNPKLPKSNLTKCQMLAFWQLEKYKNIVILPADKGNVSVVLNKDDYNQKMNDLLNDASYKRLRNNPTSKVEKKVADALKVVESKGGLSTAQRKSLANKYSTPPQLYGLPKSTRKTLPFARSSPPSTPQRTSWPNTWPTSYNLWSVPRLPTSRTLKTSSKSWRQLMFDIMTSW